MCDEMKVKLNFIENELPKLMMETTLKDQTIVKCSVNSKSHLDGFMSSIFTLKVTTRDADGK